ncbi:MAG: protein kinase [Pseudomonadota bacterium]|nr:protein kinase [Pseudomonadota bacterium]
MTVTRLKHVPAEGVPAARVPEQAGPRASDPLVGTLLDGRYRIEAMIAEGGTGRVYRAVQEALGRPVALKLMHAFAQDPRAARDFAERFLREASLAGALQHPNVVTVHDFGSLPDGRCFIVMELLAGENLAEVMRRGPLHPLDVTELFCQIVRGLRQAHRAGLVHRDMKPANVMISPGEDRRLVAKVLDFGLVKGIVADPLPGGGPVTDSAPDITQVGSFLGTPQYVSPEQATGRVADARADLYAVGVMLYRALTGVLPFDVRGSAAAVAAHVHDAVPPMGTRAPQVAVPPVLEAITLRCLQKRPGDRWPDADALLDALLAAQASLTDAAVPAPGPAPLEATLAPHVADTPLTPGPGRGLLVGGLLAALVAVVLAAAIGGAVLWRTHGSPPVAATPVPEPPAEPVLDPADADVIFAAVPPGDMEIVPATREVWLLLSSEPAGADVALDGLVLGSTPLARRLDVGPGPSARTFVVRRKGYAEARVEVDLSGEQATADVRLERLASNKAAKAPAESPSEAAPALSGVVADNVRFTGPEATAAARFVNTASHSELLGAGIAPRQVAIILEKRPFSDVAMLAEVPFIGDKTIESVRAAARKALSGG